MANPLVFGPRLWSWVHFTARRIDAMRQWDTEQSTDMYTSKIPALHRFLDDLSDHVPCVQCSHNFHKFLVDHPLPDVPGKWDISQEHLYFNWSVDAHNHANVLTHKRQMTYEEATESYEKQWLDLNYAQKMRWQQFQRIEDQAKISDLENELKWSTNKHPQLITLMVSVAIMSVVITLFLVWLLKR